MYELHEKEQYFFDEETLARLTSFLAPHAPICCLCAPLLGQHLVKAGVDVKILDVDERFTSLPGFERFDIFRPEWQGYEFRIILCDPPFYRVSLSQLFAAIRVLSLNDFRQRLMLSYLKRREAAVLGTFARFDLTPSGYFPRYQTVQRCARNDIEFYTNLGKEALEPLLSA